VSAALLILGAVVLAGVALVSRATPRRRDPGFASRGHVRELWVGHVDPARIPLGRYATPRWRPTGRLLAAPAGGSVLVLGPTQSGKTSSLVIPALLAWEGPVLAASVKSDLVVASAAWRRTQGPIGVLEPSDPDRSMGACFDPVTLAVDWESARRVASQMCEVASEESPTSDAGFWSQLAGKLLGPLLLAANGIGGDLDLVAAWIDRRECHEVEEALAARGAADALDAWAASMDRDERQRGSVYATVEATIAPLRTAAGSRAQPIDPMALLSDSGTLYLCAPAHDQRRFRSLFTSVTSEVLNAAFSMARVQGGSLRQPLLVVLDEAAAIAPLRELDVLAATCAGHGITLVTCFQDLAQIRARWGERAATVVNNHRTRILLSGLSDPAAGELLGNFAGTTAGRQAPSTARAGGVPTAPRRALVEPYELRALPAHTALVVSGRLPLTRVRLQPYWQQRPLNSRSPR